MPLVSVVMGSRSDDPLMQQTVEVLDQMGIEHEVLVISAHRTPDDASDYAKSAARRGIKILMSAAGGAAHLGGVLAAHTTLPVIGIPIKGGALNGMDSLLATLQMPSGIPVATVTLGSAGPINAAVLAAQILALGRPGMAKKVKAYKQALKRKVRKGDARVQSDLASSA